MNKLILVSSISLIVGLLIVVLILSWSLGRSHRENKALTMSMSGNALRPRQLSTQPWIVELPNFLTDKECQHLIHLGEKTGLKRSTVGNSSKSSHYDDSRTSQTAFLKKSQDFIVKQIEDKCSIVANQPSTHLEPLQIVKYEPGQYYKEHHDYLHNDKNTINGPKYQRSITLFIYLNDLNDGDKGGQTYFPKAKISVKPQIGKAVLFRNIHPDGSLDENSLHAGKPPTKSIKYGCNVWFTTLPYESAREK
jgi:prolyl 4-hydroxylase